MFPGEIFAHGERGALLNARWRCFPATSATALPDVFECTFFLTTED